MKREKLNTFIIDHLSMVCYISDMETYEMLFLSDPGLRMFGLQSEKDYLGRKCYEILQGRNSPCPYCTNAKLVRGEKYCWEHFNETLKRSASIEDSIIEIDGRFLPLLSSLPRQSHHLSKIHTIYIDMIIIT